MTRPNLRRPLRLIENSGWPNSSREIAVRKTKKNTRDPNGFYETLGVLPWATQEEIRRAYRAMAKMFHPDSPENHCEDHPVFTTGCEDCSDVREMNEELFRELQEIYDVLSDPKKREMYNMTPDGYQYIPPSEEAQVFVMSENGEMTTTDLDEEQKQELEREFNYQPPEFWRWDYYAYGEPDDRLVDAWYGLLIKLAWEIYGVGAEIRLGVIDSVMPFPYSKVANLGGHLVLQISSGLEVNRTNAIVALFYWKNTLLTSKEPYILV